MKTVTLITCLCLALSGCATNKLDKKPIAKTPKPVDPQIVELSGALTNKYVPADKRSAVLARIRVSTRQIQRTQRPPANLALIIDTSGSMRGKPIEDAKQASLALLDALSDGDVLSITAFHSRGEVFVPATKLSSVTRIEAREQIGRMRARGTTDMQAGFNLAWQEVNRMRHVKGINRIVLVSDGIPNDPKPMASWAEAARQQGMSITTLGLGLEYDETLLTELAQRSGGRFHYVEKAAQVASVFRDEVLRLEQAVATNMRLILTPGPGVDVERVTGQRVTRSGRQLVIHLGDLSEGQVRDLVVEMSVAGRRDGAVVELFDGLLSYKDMVAGAGQLTREVFLAADATGDEQNFEAGRDKAVELSVEQARAAAAIVQAVAHARTNQLPSARSVLRLAQPAAEQAAERFDDPKLHQLAKDMVELRSALPSLVPQAKKASIERELAPSLPKDAPATVRRVHATAVDSLQAH